MKRIKKLNGSVIAMINDCYQLRGIQIGIINSAVKLKGIQIGLWNKNLKRALPLFNWNF